MQTSKRYVLIVFLTLFTNQFYFFAQNAADRIPIWEDSLKRFDSSLKVTPKVRLLMKMGTAYFAAGEYDKALLYFKKVEKLLYSKQKTEAFMWAKLCNMLGLTYGSLAQGEKSMRWFERGLKVALTIKEQPALPLMYYSNMLEISYSLNQAFKTDKIAKAFIRTAYELKDTFYQIVANQQIAALKLKNEKVKEAKHYALESKRLIKYSNDESLLFHTLGIEAEICKIEKKYDQAQALFEQASELAKEHRPELSYSYKLNLANIAVLKQEYPKAQLILDETWAFFTSTGDKFQLANNLQVQAESYIAQKKYKPALETALILISLGETEFQSWAKEQIPRLYAQTGQYQKAYEQLDSLRKDQAVKLAESRDLASKMELLQQEERGKLLVTQQALKTQAALNRARLNMLGMGIALTIGLLIFMVLRNKLLKEKNRGLKLQAEAHKKSEELRAFNYSLGHDLKAPIDNAMLFLNRFEQKFKNLDQEGREYLQNLSIIMKDTRGMINGMLSYAEQDQIPMFSSEIDTKKEVETLAQTIHSIELDREIEIQISELPVVKGDKLMLRQVLSNLISNAAKFTRLSPKAKIEVFARKNEEFWEIYIKDNGTGIPENTQSRLFQLFKTAHDRSVYPGTGVGLSIVKRVIERHHGKVWAYNNPEGGATFGFSIPV